MNAQTIMPSRGLLLMIDDEDAVVRPLVAALEREGYQVRRFARAEDAIDRLEWLRPDLVILDVALPGMSGLRACELIRRRTGTPVLMLTARGSESDRLEGFKAGADDYLTKPFSIRELEARIRAILRRRSAHPPEPEAEVAVGELVLDAARHEVRLAGEPVALSPREFALLEYLMRRSPAAVARAELVAQVWDEHWSGPTKTLDVHVAQVRRKLGDGGAEPRYLHTVRGVGYRVLDRCAAG
jgi:two-component system response regulator RegX3